jgi:hypothetical protein
MRTKSTLLFRIPDGNLIGFPNRGFCVKTQELRHLLQEKVASFIGQHRLFACPEGYDDAFACFLIRHEISAFEAFLFFTLGNNVRFEKPDGLIDPVDFQLNPEQTRKHGTSSFSLTEDPNGTWSISWPDFPFRLPGQRIPILEPGVNLEGKTDPRFPAARPGPHQPFVKRKPTSVLDLTAPRSYDKNHRKHS